MRALWRCLCPLVVYNIIFIHKSTITKIPILFATMLILIKLGFNVSFYLEHFLYQQHHLHGAHYCDFFHVFVQPHHHEHCSCFYSDSVVDLLDYVTEIVHDFECHLYKLWEFDWKMGRKLVIDKFRDFFACDVYWDVKFYLPAIE